MFKKMGLFLIILSAVQPSHGMFRCKQDDEQRGCLSRLRKNIRRLSPRKYAIAGCMVLGTACGWLTKIFLATTQEGKDIRDFNAIEQMAFEGAFSNFSEFEPKLVRAAYRACAIGQQEWYNKLCDWWCFLQEKACDGAVRVVSDPRCWAHVYRSGENVTIMGWPCQS